LKSNIEAFYFGLRINKDLDAAHNLLRQHAQLLQAQNQTINNLNSKIGHLVFLLCRLNGLINCVLFGCTGTILRFNKGCNSIFSFLNSRLRGNDVV